MPCKTTNLVVRVYRCTCVYTHTHTHTHTPPPPPPPPASPPTHHHPGTGRERDSHMNKLKTINSFAFKLHREQVASVTCKSKESNKHK